MHLPLGRKTFFLKKTKRVAVFCCIFFPTVLFAQGATEPSLNQAATIDLLQKIIAVASWIWVVPAALAGKFMTNYFIYGDSFYLASYLFKFRQIIRTFAYFALGFYFMGQILYIWFNDKEAKSGLAGLISNTVIAGFLIGGSRWLIAAAVDLSIVFTSAVASIPSQIYQNNRTTTKQQCFSAPIQVNVNEDLTADPVKLSEKTNRKPIERKDVAPDGSNVAGPLTFFASSVLGFFDLVFLPEASNDNNEPRINSAGFIIVVVKAIMAIMLIVPLFVLVVVNLIRIVYLRLWIVFSPFIVLINIFGMKITDGLQKYIDRKNILGLILQPVAVVGMLSVGLILVIELTSVFNLCTTTKAGSPLDNSSVAAKLNQKDVAPIGDELFEVTLTASLSQLGNTLGGITGELILAAFVIILLWSLLKVGFSFSELTSKVANDITKGTEDIVGTLPVVHLPGMGGGIGYNTIKQQIGNKFGLDNYITNKNNEQQQDVLDRVGLGDGKVKLQDIGKIKQLAKAPGTTLQTLQTEITQKLEKGRINASDAKEIVKTWLSSDGKTIEDNKKLLSSLGINNTLASITPEQIEKLRTDESSKQSRDARKLMNRLFTKGTDQSETKIDAY